MLLGALQYSNLYATIFVLHILAVMVAFAPAFVVPVIQSRFRKRGEPVPAAVMEMFAKNGVQIHGPALVLVGIFGFGLVSVDSPWEFSQPWVSIALLLWFIMLGIVFLVLIPTEKKVATHGGDEALEQRLAAFGGMVHVLLLLMVIDMVFKPFGIN